METSYNKTKGNYEKTVEHTGEVTGEQAGAASQRPTQQQENKKMSTVPYKKEQENKAYMLSV